MSEAGITFGFPIPIPLPGKEERKDPRLRAAERQAKRNLGLTERLDKLRRNPEFVSEVDRLLLGAPTPGIATPAPESFGQPVSFATGFGVPTPDFALPGQQDPIFGRGPQFPFPSGEGGPRINIQIGLQSVLGALGRIFGGGAVRQAGKTGKVLKGKFPPKKGKKAANDPRGGTGRPKPKQKGRDIFVGDPSILFGGGNVGGGPVGGVGPPAPAPQKPIPEIVTTPGMSEPKIGPLGTPQIRQLAKIAAFGLAGAAVGRAILSRGSSRGRRATASVPDPRPVPVPGAPPVFQLPFLPFGAPTAAGGLKTAAQARESAVGKTSVSPDAQLRACKQEARRCEKKRRENRKTCRSGFFKESKSSTKFKTWRRFDCVTGKTISEV